MKKKTRRRQITSNLDENEDSPVNYVRDKKKPTVTKVFRFGERRRERKRRRRVGTDLLVNLL